MSQGPQQILKKYWGYDAFRPLQEEIIGSVLNNTDTVALLPTGGGKSLCYQVPALIMPGLTLVISPLIALMQDQVKRLTELDIPAASIHSGMNYAAVKQTLDNALHDAYKLLYLSPERLQTGLFRDYIDNLDVSLVAVDEAHCISQWGHDFRPDYLKISDLRAGFPRVPVLALTASATPEVQADMEQQLGMRKAAVFKQSFSRRNIFYSVRYSENKIGDALNKVGKDCSIIYCRSRKQTESVGRSLVQDGRNAAVYHAGMNKENREHAQETWMNGAAPTMVATTAFGMGIDKPNVRMVLHCDAPEHLEAYYQEAGRAGRDGQPSVAVTLFNSSDTRRLYESTAIRFPAESYLRTVYQSVVEYLQLPIGVEPDKYFPFDLVDFCDKFRLKPAHAIHALKLLEQEGLWTLTESVYSPATIKFLADRDVLDSLRQANPELNYVTTGLLRMYNTIFHFPTAVRETAIARQLRMSKAELEQALALLHRMGILEYNKPTDGPQLFFHHYRVDSRHLVIDLKRIALLRARHEARTAAMISFLENKTECRENILLRYFGETAEQPCGHCDICDSRTPHAKRPDIRTSVLQQIKNSPSGIQQLLSAWPEQSRDEVIAIVRKLIDEQILILDERNILRPAS